MDMLYKDLQEKNFVIAGPCVIESEPMVMELAEKLREAAIRKDFSYIFKASFDKANRTSVSSYRGPGMEEGLRILEKVKKEFGVPVLTDIHEANQADTVAEVVDILQIPAFLCRQTDLLLAAGKTGKIVNIKKAQFLSGNNMIYPAQKVESTGNKKIMLTERGNIFGYGNLVVDYTNMLDMQKMGYPVIIDATHSVQKPTGEGGVTGGNRKYVPYIAKAAAAIGIKGFFFEVHPDPDNAKSDGPNMVELDKFERILGELKLIYEVIGTENLNNPF